MVRVHGAALRAGFMTGLSRFDGDDGGMRFVVHPTQSGSLIGSVGLRNSPDATERIHFFD